ncbi:MAG: aminopeptidase [Thermoplasmata archaeon]
MSLENGCKTAVNTCMNIRPDDRVLIVSDKETLKIGQKLKDIILDITPQMRFFNLDIYGNRPLKKLPDQIESEARASTATFWTAQSIDGELESVRMPFFQAAVYKGRHAHMVNITEEIVEKGLGGDYREIERFTNKVHSMAVESKEVRMTSEKGTDLTAKVGKYKWIASTGIIQQIGQWHNLPDGEIFTTPYEMEGTLVVDGTLGDYFDGKYPLDTTLEDPLYIEIENKEKPQAVKVECDNDTLEHEIQDYLNRNRCSSYIGELGIGTNLLVDELIGNMLLDEKHPGIHIAFGDPLNNMTFAGWSCPTHLDMIVRDSNIWFDDKQIIEKGKYLI